MLRALAFPEDDIVLLDDAWLSPGIADAAKRALLTEVPWRQDAITLFGRRVLQPRLSAWMGDPAATYTYSGLTLTPTPWTPAVADLLARVRATTGAAYNSVLLNLYRDGNDSMGLHADDEPELGPAPNIASVSLGATRRFVLKPKKRDEARHAVRLALTHGSLLVMRGATQRHFVHGVPKEPKVTAPRINLTFRCILPR